MLQRQAHREYLLRDSILAVISSAWSPCLVFHQNVDVKGIRELRESSTACDVAQSLGADRLQGFARSNLTL